MRFDIPGRSKPKLLAADTLTAKCTTKFESTLDPRKEPIRSAARSGGIPQAPDVDVVAQGGEVGDGIGLNDKITMIRHHLGERKDVRLLQMLLLYPPIIHAYAAVICPFGIIVN